MTILTQGFALLIVYFTCITYVFADDTKIICNDEKSSCNVTFTVVQPLPDFSVLACTSPVVVGPFTITNHLSFPVNIGTPFLKQEDSLNVRAVTIASTTCKSSLGGYESCNIFLDFQPCVSGNLDWVLEVPVYTQQAIVTTPLDSIVLGTPYAYITNNNNNMGTNSVSICTLLPNGQFNSCMPVSTLCPISPYCTPVDIILKNINGTVYAYVTDFVNDKILQCTVDQASGLLTHCGDSGGTDFNGPYNLTTLQTINNSLYAYVTNAGNTTMEYVTQCTVLQTAGPTAGNLSGCVDSGAGDVFGRPYGILYAYVANVLTNEISQCMVDSTTGEFIPGSCIMLTDPTVFNNPVQIAFQTFNNILYAYVTNEGNGTVIQCAVNPVNGRFPASPPCTVVGSSFSEPSGIIFESINSTLYAYVTNKGNKTVSQCFIDPTTGVFTSCIDSGVGTVFNAPSSIAFLN